MRRKASLPNCLIENGFQGRLSGQVEKKMVFREIWVECSMCLDFASSGNLIMVV